MARRYRRPRCGSRRLRCLRAASQAIEIHGLMQAVVDGFADQRMIRDADFAGQIFRAGHLIRETRRRADRRSACAEWARALCLPPRKRRIASARDAFQRQRAVNIGAASSAWVSTCSSVCGFRNSNTSSSGNACCSLSEMSMPLSVAAACSSKLKVRQKRLRSASPQARLMRVPKGACNHQLHAAGLHRRTARRRRWFATAARPAPPRRPVRRRLPASRRLHRARTRLVSKFRSCRLQDLRAASRKRACDSSADRPGASPSQNGTDGGAPCASSTYTRPGAHALDAPRVRAQQEDVAGQALHREILIQRADVAAIRLGCHGVVRVVGNRAAGGDGRQPRAAPAAHATVHLIAMQECSAAPARCRDAFGQHVDDWHRNRRAAGCDKATRCGPARTDSSSSQLSHAAAATICCARISSAFSGISSRSSSPRRMARISAAHSISSSRVVANRRAFGCRAHPVARPAKALQRDRDGARRADLHHQIHRADIDAQFERCRGHHRPQIAVLQPRFGVQPQRSRETAVMRQHRVLRPAARPGHARSRSESRRVLTNTSVVRCARISSAMRS